jgi:hypothetical protein
MDATRHASIRAQQRAIPPLVVDLLLQFGHRERAGDGAYKVYLDKLSRRRLDAHAGAVSRALNEHLDVYLIVGADERVVTMGHRSERIRRN